MSPTPFEGIPDDELRARLRDVRAKLRNGRVGVALSVIGIWVLSFALFPGAVASGELFPTLPSAVISIGVIAMHLVAERRVRRFEAQVAAHLGPGRPGDAEEIG